MGIYGRGGEIFPQIEPPEFGSVGWIGGVKAAITGTENDAVIEGQRRAFDAAAGFKGPCALAVGPLDGMQGFVAAADVNVPVIDGGSGEKGKIGSLIDPRQAIGFGLGGDELVGVVAAIDRGSGSGDGISDLGISHDLVQEGAILQIEDMDDLVATAEDDEAIVEDGGRAIDIVVGFVGPDLRAIGGA